MIPKKILILRPDSIRDYVLFSGCFRYIKDFFKECHISIFVQNHIAELAQKNPFVDEVIPFYMQQNGHLVVYIYERQ